ncbi:hypothetical protein [Aquimarina sediminis]|uniref:hypothetical protein n=1 Tax=Aquimarina sediminis TaxID=2070536 RepID=UPI000FFE83AF|nr:hypothetical protein [Aquimarina sediminis]
MKKKVGQPKKGSLNKIEEKILDYLCDNLDEKNSKKIIEQLEYLVKILRLDYTNDTITELYPENLNELPSEILFERREEFRLAHLKFMINEEVYISKIRASLGILFDIKIRPIPPKKVDFSSKFELIQIKLEPNLDTNIHGRKTKN